MRILGIDPGDKNCGVAVLSGETCLYHKYLSKDDGIRVIGQAAQENPVYRWFMRLKGVCVKNRIETVVYEDFVYQGRRTYSKNTMIMCQIIGAIRVLRTVGDVRDIVGIRPDVWRQQLIGNAKAKDDEVSWVIEKRLGIDPLADHGRVRGQHVLDAIGVALCWQDRQSIESRIKEAK